MLNLKRIAVGVTVFLGVAYVAMWWLWPITMEAYRQLTGTIDLGLYVIYALLILGGVVICGVAFGGKDG